ncbi:MAG: AraC family transcriptional regulator [Clostridia bacterium]|nr:AraC family transcriptional regulator [Clostridia bacterium]
MEYFKSDLSLFSMEVTECLKMMSFPPIREYLNRKHAEERDADKSAFDKKNDLLIWNGVLCREITRLGVYRGMLHLLYNRFYDRILKTATLKELQQTELEMFEGYIKGMLYETETTDHYSVNKILQFIHISLEGPLSLKLIAEGVHLSAGYISKAFRKVVGKPVMQYVKEIKVERAKTHLLDWKLSVSEIADLLGFYDVSHFSRVFKEICGVTPLVFRTKQGLV